jgi:hypothetical protein
VSVHDEDNAVANAGVADPGEQAVDGDDGSKHPAELSVGGQGHRNDQRGTAALSQSKRLADKRKALDTGGECVFQCDLHEGITIGAKASGGLALGLAVDGCDVQNVLIIFDETLEQARKLRRVRGVVHIHDPSGQSKDLALAEKLFIETLLEFQSLTGERTSDFTLLNALGVLKFLIAEIEHLAMIEPQRRDTDEQKGAEHNPKDAQTPSHRLLEGFSGHRDFPQ